MKSGMTGVLPHAPPQTSRSAPRSFYSKHPRYKLSSGDSRREKREKRLKAQISVLQEMRENTQNNKNPVTEARVVPKNTTRMTLPQIFRGSPRGGHGDMGRGMGGFGFVELLAGRDRRGITSLPYINKQASIRSAAPPLPALYDKQAARPPPLPPALSPRFPRVTQKEKMEKLLAIKENRLAINSVQDLNKFDPVKAKKQNHQRVERKKRSRKRNFVAAAMASMAAKAAWKAIHKAGAALEDMFRRIKIACREAVEIAQEAAKAASLTNALAKLSIANRSWMHFAISKNHR